MMLLRSQSLFPLLTAFVVAGCSAADLDGEASGPPEDAELEGGEQADTEQAAIDASPEEPLDSLTADTAAPGYQLQVTTSSSGTSVYTDHDSPYFTVTDSGSGRFHLAIDLRPAGRTHYQKVRFSIYNEGSTSGWAINIGDSKSNNGYAGDGGHQSNDAELQILNNKLSVYASDYGGSRLLYQTPSVMPLDGAKNLRIRVEDGKISHWKNFNPSSTRVISSPYLFALKGQNDSTGPEDYKIYAGINRVVSNTSRTGSGVARVYVYLEGPLPNLHQRWDFHAYSEGGVLDYGHWSSQDIYLDLSRPRMGGNDSCNSIFSEYRVSPPSGIEFWNIGGTKRGCFELGPSGEELPIGDRRFRDTLPDVYRYSLSSSELRLCYSSSDCMIFR